MSLNIGIDIRPLMDKNYSGVGEYTLNFLQAIFEEDQKNRYFLFYNSAKKEVRDNLPKFDYANVTYCGFKYPNKIFNLSLLVLNKPKIDKLIEKKYLNGGKLDLFFTPNVNFTAISKDCPHIITVHDLSFEKFPEFYSHKGRLWHKIINFRNILKKAAKIIAVSENTKRDIVEIYNISSEKIKTIYSGISEEYRVIENGLEKNNEIRRKYGLPAEFILYLGNIESRKNLESLIEAFDEIGGDTGLVLAGGKGWGYKNIKKTANKAQNCNKIIFTGYINKRDKPYLYNMAKVFVYPSYYEGFGFPPLEALACGTPVITSYSSSLPEIVGNSAIVIDPFNIKDIKLALRNVLRDRESELRKNGVEIAKKFTWNSSAKDFLKIIEKLA